MPEDYTFWRPATAPDPTKAPPLNIAGIAGAFLGGQEARQNLDKRKASGENLSAGDYLGGFASGILRGKAIEKEMTDPMSGIKQTLDRQNQVMNNLQILEAMDRREQTIKQRMLNDEFGKFLQGLIESGQSNNPDAQEQVLGWLARNPQAGNSDAIKEQLKLFQGSRTYMDAQAQVATNRALNLAKGLQPGQSISVPGVGSASVDRLHTAADSTTDIRNTQFVTTLRQQIASLPTGSPERAAREQELATFMQQTAPRGTIIRQNADGSTEVIQGAPVSGDLTQAQRGTTKLQADKLTATARRIGEVIPHAANLFGPTAATKSFVVDRMLANLNPQLAEGQRIQGRTKAGLVMEGLIQSLSEGQGQLSNQDIKRLKSHFPELNDPSELIESPKRAEEILTAIQKELARDAYERARTLGENLPPDVLTMMDPFTLASEFRAKRITREQIREALLNNVHQEDVRRLEEAR